jgi:hypothetical protein
MTYEDIRKIALENRAKKQASDIDEKIKRSSELMNELVKNMQAKQASEQPRQTTACQRALRRHLMAQKAASDPRTPLQKVKDILDAKVASDPALKAMKIIGEARAAKEAAEVKQQQARTVKLEQAAHKEAPFEKPLEGQENKDEGRSVTFSDGRTVNFPAAHTTPVKSASDRVKEILAAKKAQENAAQPPLAPMSPEGPVQGDTNRPSRAQALLKKILHK